MSIANQNLLAAAAVAHGRKITSVKSVSGGYTAAERAVLVFEDGSSAFLKAAVDELTAGWLKDEEHMYRAVVADFIPALLGKGECEGLPFLMLEDLSAAEWPPPWDRRKVAEAVSALERIHSYPAPEHLGTLEEYRRELGGWEAVQSDSTGFLSLELCDSGWLAENIAVIVKAERAAVLSGNDLVHLDVRSDNMCFASDRAVLVDWNHCRRGNGKIDLISWLPSLDLETDIAPWDIGMDEPELLAMLTGYFARTAATPSPRPGLQQLRLSMLKAAWPWMCRSLNLII